MEIDVTDLSPRAAYLLMTAAIAPRPIAWVASQGAGGIQNLAPFSFFQMISGRPPTLIISASLPDGEVPKDTVRNIAETGDFTVNLISFALKDQMNETSFGYGPDISEFDRCGVASRPSVKIKAPRVSEAPISFECIARRIQPYPDDHPSCHLIFGEVVMAHLDPKVLDDAGAIDPDKLDLIARMGGDWYGRMRNPGNFQLSRPMAEKPASPP